MYRHRNNQQHIPIALIESLKSESELITFLFYLKLRIQTRRSYGHFTLDKATVKGIGYTRRTCLKQLDLGVKMGWFIPVANRKGHYHIKSAYCLAVKGWTKLYRTIRCCVIHDEMVLEAHAHNTVKLKNHFEESVTELHLKQIEAENRKKLKYDKFKNKRTDEQVNKLYTDIYGSIKYGSCSLVAGFNKALETSILRRRAKIGNSHPDIKYSYKSHVVKRCNAALGYEYAMLYNEAIRDNRATGNEIADKLLQQHRNWGYFYYSQLQGVVIYSPPSVRVSTLTLSKVKLPSSCRKMVNVQA